MQKVINELKEKVEGILPAKRTEEVNRKIAENVEYYKLENEEVIKNRIDELNNEWDMERAVLLNSSLVVLAGIILGATANKKWLAVSGAVSGMVALFAVKGWSLPIFGENLRTRREISREQIGLQEILKNDSIKKYEI